MWRFLWALLLPFLTSACLCPSCGCGGGGYGGGSYGGGYSGGGGGYGYGQPYNTFFNQPLPGGRGVEVRAPFYGQQQAQPQYLPQLQAPPQYSLQAPQSQGYAQSPTLIAPRPSNPSVVAPRLNTGYTAPIPQSSNVGWQPARPVETLRSRAITSATSAPYTGTTRIVPAKKAGKNSDYEYYYVYYDENGKKTGTGTAKPKLHDGSIQSRSTSAPQNTIDEYDFDDAKDVGGEVPTVTTAAPVNEPVTIPLPSVTPLSVAVPMFDEPHGEVHSVEEDTTVATTEFVESSVRTTAATSVVVENGDPIYDDIDAGKKETTKTEAPSTEAPVQEETVTFETAAPTTAELTTAEAASSVSPSTETVPGKEEPKMYEYEEYEVEEISLVNENGVTETVTRIITTTKPPPKRQV